MEIFAIIAEGTEGGPKSSIWKVGGWLGQTLSYVSVGVYFEGDKINSVCFIDKFAVLF